MQNNTSIYLIRHGLDDERFIGGWSNGNLTDTGIKQIEQATVFIEKNIPEITSIYHSGIARTIETTEIINKKLHLPTFSLEDLRELNKGDLNGLDVKLAEKLYPKFFPNPQIDERYPHGESLLDLYTRVKSFLEKIDQYDKTLLVTHRGFINALYFLLNDIEPNYNKTQFDVDHASIHKLELKKIKRIY